MQPTRTPQTRKCIAVGIALVAFLVPTAASAYPVIGDEPDQAAGQAWMAAHKQTVKQKPATRSTTPKPRICQPKTSGCVRP